ncbi:LytTR family transcriptional regulator DNA-binding domain-containing protein [Limosilactobacillus agrestimuris]|uniref:LytTR family transcriptional regulator DNA-binding domain-containing protein n=1 Tax=Limosilactobacillus agrestimuris TaxID=2941331 RepID=UPI00203F55A7|nr:LytTR family transcriptional regulator DNA-binding domain-containing protein [Limosilactobacillus agrestimuris]
MLKVFIMEDDVQQLTELKSITEQIITKLDLSDSLVLTFDSTTDLAHALPKPGPENVYILDLQINYNKRAGLQLGQLIRQSDPDATIIFITVHDELLYTAYKYRVQALDFISKDQDNIYQELLKDFRLLTHRQQQQQANVFTYKSYKKDPRFYRVHRSYLVNPHTVKNVDFYSRQIVFYNGLTCPVSRRKARDFFELVRQLKHPQDENLPKQKRK